MWPIDELISARLRGWTDLAINGSYWLLGAAAGAGATVLLLDTSWLPQDLAWRLVFVLGGVLGVAIVFVRRNVPESPRWLLTHGYPAEAERVVADIEGRVRADARIDELPEPGSSITIHRRRSTGFGEIARTIFVRYRRRGLVGLSLMIAQAFFYNAIFFTYALVLTTFYDVSAARVGLFLLPFAAGNFLGPLLLGRLFDTLGRRLMIAITYGISGVLLAVTGVFFVNGWLDAVTQTLAWSVVFFFASAAASAAYLTVSRGLPPGDPGDGHRLLLRGGHGGGRTGRPRRLRRPGSEQAADVFAGYLVGSGLMLAAAVIAGIWGVNAERRALEDIAPPLSTRSQAESGGGEG